MQNGGHVKAWDPEPIGIPATCPGGPLSPTGAPSRSIDDRWLMQRETDDRVARSLLDIVALGPDRAPATAQDRGSARGSSDVVRVALPGEVLLLLGGDAAGVSAATPPPESANRDQPERG